jgi:Flp pilus assembly pilin Flp
MTPIDLHARLTRLRSEEAGQTLIEYAGMVLLVSIAVILLMSALGLDLAEWFDAIEDTLGVGDGNTVDTMPGTDDTSAPSGVVG